MPIAYVPDMASTLPGQKHPFGSPQYGHQIRFASKCGHRTHPSSAEHTPWCSSCAVSQARGKSDVALKKLVAEGGLFPPEYMRNQRWNRARKGYVIAKKQLDRARTDEQLRWEREQAWNHAHERTGTQRPQAAAVLPENCSLCPACDSMVASYPTNIPEAQVAAYAAWWERPGALATSTHLFGHSRKPCQRHNQHRRYAPTMETHPNLRQIVRDVRKQTIEKEKLDRAWYARNTAERAIRNKYNLGLDFDIPKDFWDSPLSLLISRLVYQQTKDQNRTAERYARGSKSRPIPPRSPLSQSQSLEDLQVDPGFAEKLKEEEEKERLGRQVEKVAREVGYLYFVGNRSSDMGPWNEAFEQSDKLLVCRVQGLSESSSSGEDMDEDDDDDNDDDHKEADLDDMDIDES